MSEAAQVDSSVVKDGAQDAAAVMSVTDVAQNFLNADKATVQKALDANPALHKRVLEMSDAELEELEQQLKQKQTPPGVNGEAPVLPKSDSESLPQSKEDEEIVIKLKPSDLGTYLANGRSPQEAIAELVKGKKNADERIEFLKNEQLPQIERTARTLAEKNEALQRELEELKNKKVESTQAPQAQAEKPVDDDFEIPAPDDIDFFDTDQQKKVMDILVKARDRNEALKKKVAELSTAPAKQPEPKPAPAQAAAPAPVDESVVQEFDQIRMLQRNPDTEGVFSTKIDVMEVEKQNLAFMENLAQLHGIATIFDSSGKIVPAVSKLVSDYYDLGSQAGQSVRSVAEAKGIKPPEDLPALNRIYTIRNLRLKYSSRNPITGNLEPIPYDEAHRMARAMMPELFAQPTASETRNAQREAVARAVEHRQQFAPDPKSASSTEMSSISKIPIEEFNRLIKKPTSEYTPHELETMRAVYAANGMSEAEINQLLTV